MSWLADVGCSVLAGSSADFGKLIVDETEKMGQRDHVRRYQARLTNRGWQTFHNLPFCEPPGAYVRERPREWDEFRAALAELRAAVTARWEAEARLAQLYRERAIARARAVERHPKAMLN